MKYLEAVAELLIALSKIEHEGYNVSVVEDTIKIADEDGENAYFYELRYEPQEDRCVWWAVPAEALAA